MEVKSRVVVKVERIKPFKNSREASGPKSRAKICQHLQRAAALRTRRPGIIGTRGVACTCRQRRQKENERQSRTNRQTDHRLRSHSGLRLDNYEPTSTFSSLRGAGAARSIDKQRGHRPPLFLIPPPHSHSHLPSSIANLIIQLIFIYILRAMWRRQVFAQGGREVSLFCKSILQFPIII